MRIFGRTLFCALMIVLLGSLAVILWLGRSSPAGLDNLLLASSAALLLWSACFLKTESTLTRIALLTLLLCLMMVVWAAHQVVT